MSKILLFLLLISLTINGCLAPQWELCKENNAASGFVIDIAIASMRVKRGMTYQEAISLVHHDPDKVEITNEGKLCAWSAFYHYGPLERILGHPQANGHRWLYIVFDDQDKVVRVEFTEA